MVPLLIQKFPAPPAPMIALSKSLRMAWRFVALVLVNSSKTPIKYAPDVVAEAEFLDKDTKVEIIEIHGNRVVVTAVENQS